MIKVKCSYINQKSKSGSDYFIFVDIEVIGHAEHSGYNTNTKVCAGVSACCYGIRRLIDDEQFNTDIKKGYFHIWTERTRNLRQQLDRDSVYALNTLVCQLYEIYCQYPSSFKSFELIDVKENKLNDEQRNKPRKKSPRKRMGLLACLEDTYYQEN